MPFNDFIMNNYIILQINYGVCAHFKRDSLLFEFKTLFSWTILDAFLVTKFNGWTMDQESKFVRLNKFRLSINDVIKFDSPIHPWLCNILVDLIKRDMGLKNIIRLCKKYLE